MATAKAWRHLGLKAPRRSSVPDLFENGNPGDTGDAKA